MKRALLLLFLCCTAGLSFGQGCSDAGFCTAPGFAPLGDTASPIKLGFKLSLESTEPGALLISPQINAGFKLAPKIYGEVKIPIWLITDDQLGSNYAMSDPIFSFSFQIFDDEVTKVTINAGTRIGVGNATKLGNIEGEQLPMDYQNSLGTTDLLIGLNVKHIAGFSSTIGIQYPVWQYNENQHVVNKYIDPAIADTVKFNYYRSPDVMLGLDKSWNIGHWGVKIGLLPIFHMSDDELRSTTHNASTIIKKSAGLTLNIPFGFWYTHNNWVLGADAGFPVITRTERPDGLTRKFVVQPRIVYNFD